MNDHPTPAERIGCHSRLRLRLATLMGIVGLCSSIHFVANTADAAPQVRCVAVRKPTTQQREQSAADVERLLDHYETKTNDSSAWPLALAEVFDRFPLPSVNMLMALHHPAWIAPEQKLVAYLEAIRQDPGDYADPAAVAQTIQRIEQTLLPEVRREPIVMIEVRGVVRRQDLTKLDLRVDNQTCSTALIEGSETYSVSWTSADQRLSARVTPQRLSAAISCVAIEGDQSGPCDGKLNRELTAPDALATVPATNTPTVGKDAPKRQPAQPQANEQAAQRPLATSTDQPSHLAAKPSAVRLDFSKSSAASRTAEPGLAKPPSIDYALAVPGLALAAAGITVAVVARTQVDSHMDRAQSGAEPQCEDHQCTPAGMSDVLAARDWATGYYVAGATGLLGLGIVLVSGYRYYTHWLSPQPKPMSDRAQSPTPSVTLQGVRAGAGVLLRSSF